MSPKDLFTKIFGTRFQRELKRIRPVVDAIHGHEDRLKGLSDAELQAQTPKLRGLISERTGALGAEVERLKREKHDCPDAAQRATLSDQLSRAETTYVKALQGALSDMLPEAFATVREACRRLLGSEVVVTGHALKWDMVPYDVQLIGGIVLHQGKIAEMATGEGKTLVATLPLYLNALVGRGAHLVTVNNYLARRDSQWMGHLFTWLGLTVGCIDDTEPSTPERRAAYLCDITYGTNNEFGFDYLRDNMVFTLEQRVQRGHAYAIIDEVDSILIDEARTPLIISGAVGSESDEKYAQFNAQVVQLVRKQTAVVNDLIARAEPLLADDGVETMPPEDPNLFVVTDISHAVHEIERDENLSPKEKIERRRQVEADYAMKSETLHIIHKLLQAHALYEREVDYVVQEGKVLIVDEFTGRLMHGRRWSEGLHQAVEAKEGVAVQEESQTLATITIQNYFRMYDKLAGMTGTAETEETEFFQIYGLEVVVIPTNRPVRRIDKHDLIYKTRREKYNALMDEVERQHKRGLPVLVGTVSVDVSETLSRMLKRRGLRHQVLNAKYHEREAEIVAQAGQPRSIPIPTHMAGRGTAITLSPGGKNWPGCRSTTPQAPFGQQIEKPDLSSEEIKRLQCQEDPPCGLVIVGTERHEARRIDRQLRGRSGRQGDPGQTVFFLSLEDDLMRLFGSDRIARWMDRTGAEEGEVITHPWVTSAIGQAQKRVELQNFQARKKLLEYDDVMNQQREVIYSLRLFALEGGEELRAEALRMVEQAVEQLADGLIAEFDDPAQWDRALFETDFLQKFLISVPGVTDPTVVHNRDDLVRAAQQAAREAFQAKLDNLKNMEKDVEAQLGALAGSVRLGERALSRFMLGVIDEKWKDHLYDLDQLREGIYYRSWGQKDPLVEYKTEAFEMFKGLMSDVENTFAEGWFKDWWRNMPIEITVPGGAPGAPGAPGALRPPARTLTGPAGGQPGGGGRRPAPVVATKPAADGLITSNAPALRAPTPEPAFARNPYAGVGRNDPRPCGSGKKFKKCHGASA